MPIEACAVPRCTANGRSGECSSRVQSRPMSVDEVAASVRRHVENVVLPAFPTAGDGRLRLTLFGRCMPPDWLWTPECLLPVIIAVGARRRYGITVPLRRAADTIAGYVLDGETLFDCGMVDEAIALTSIEKHHLHHPGNTLHGRDGAAVEFMNLFSRKNFVSILVSADLEPTFVSFNICERLPIRLLDDPAALEI